MKTNVRQLTIGKATEMSVFVSKRIRRSEHDWFNRNGNVNFQLRNRYTMSHIHLHLATFGFYLVNCFAGPSMKAFVMPHTTPTKIMPK